MGGSGPIPDHQAFGEGSEWERGALGLGPLPGPIRRIVKGLPAVIRRRPGTDGKHERQRHCDADGLDQFRLSHHFGGHFHRVRAKMPGYH
jgi:hypothetical protein